MPSTRREDAILADERCARLTLSLGAATYPEDGETCAALTRAADEALYRAKRLGTASGALAQQARA